jgi:hypothetical protein
MKWYRIDTAPGNEDILILRDNRENAAVFEIARWSTEKANWIRDDEPILISPTHWMPLPDTPWARRKKETQRRMKRLDFYAGLLAIAGLAIVLFPSVLDDLAERERVGAVEVASGATNDRSPQTSSASARAESRIEVRTPAEAGAPIEAGEAVQALIREQKNALEQERQRGDALARELASAQKAIEALRAQIGTAIPAPPEAAPSTDVTGASPEAGSLPTVSPTSTGLTSSLQNARDECGSGADAKTAAHIKATVEEDNSASTRTPKPRPDPIAASMPSLRGSPESDCAAGETR